MDDIRPTSPEMDKADALDENHPDNWPVIFDSSTMLPKTFARIADAARALGVGWKIQHRREAENAWFHLAIDDVPSGFAGVSGSYSGHKTIDDAIEHLAMFLADAIYRRGASVRFTAGHFAYNPSTYGLRELRQALGGYDIGPDTTKDAVELGGPLLAEAVRYLREVEWTEEDRKRPDPKNLYCRTCHGYPDMVLPGDPAQRPGHHRHCAVAMFLNKFEGLIPEKEGR